MGINNISFQLSYIGSAVGALIASGAGAYGAKLVTKNGMRFINFLHKDTFSEETIKSTAGRMEKAAALVTGLAAFVFLKFGKDIQDFMYMDYLPQLDPYIEDQIWQVLDSPHFEGFLEIKQRQWFSFHSNISSFLMPHIQKQIWQVLDSERFKELLKQQLTH